MATSEEVSITDARARLSELVKRTARARERFTLTSSDIPAAVLINTEELHELEERLIVAELMLEESRGIERRGLPIAEARRRLGL